MYDVFGTRVVPEFRRKPRRLSPEAGSESGEKFPGLIQQSRLHPSLGALALDQRAFPTRQVAEAGKCGIDAAAAAGQEMLLRFARQEPLQGFPKRRPEHPLRQRRVPCHAVRADIPPQGKFFGPLGAFPQCEGARNSRFPFGLHNPPFLPRAEPGGPAADFRESDLPVHPQRGFIDRIHLQINLPPAFPANHIQRMPDQAARDPPPAAFGKHRHIRDQPRGALRNAAGDGDVARDPSRLVPHGRKRPFVGQDHPEPVRKVPCQFALLGDRAHIAQHPAR